jgi:hypothetical protein
MRLIGKNDDRARYHLWPIRLKWKTRANNLSLNLSHWGWHGWQTGAERVPEAKTSFGCMPGYRKTFGQTLYLGRLLVILGPKRGQDGGTRG